jgi:hypothetical protein
MSSHFDQWENKKQSLSENTALERFLLLNDLKNRQISTTFLVLNLFTFLLYKTGYISVFQFFSSANSKKLNSYNYPWKR